MRHVYLITLFVCVLTVSVLGFRETKFTAPPLDVFPEWIFPGMKYQPKLRPQSESAFFADGRADRMPVPRTVARGMLRDDDHLHHGKNAAGAFAAGFPAVLAGKVDLDFIRRGQGQFQIYCTPCHGVLGDGNGITKKYGMGATPTFHDPRIRTMPEGEIYNTIANGKNTMQGYADKIAPEDRWAVIAYVRALQRAQQGVAADVTDATAKQTLGLP
ncbi:MAG: cytochrome c [Opitutaceae bacterium]|nr:cytochrome c [Opitutaceae bacterium]